MYTGYCTTYLDVEPLVEVSHVVEPGREGSLLRRDRDRVESKVLHEKLRFLFFARSGGGAE